MLAGRDNSGGEGPEPRDTRCKHTLTDIDQRAYKPPFVKRPDVCLQTPDINDIALGNLMDPFRYCPVDPPAEMSIMQDKPDPHPS